MNGEEQQVQQPVDRMFLMIDEKRSERDKAATREGGHRAELSALSVSRGGGRSEVVAETTSRSERQMQERHGYTAAAALTDVAKRFAQLVSVPFLVPPALSAMSSSRPPGSPMTVVSKMGGVPYCELQKGMGEEGLPESGKGSVDVSAGYHARRGLLPMQLSHQDCGPFVHVRGLKRKAPREERRARRRRLRENGRTGL